MLKRNTTRERNITHLKSGFQIMWVTMNCSTRRTGLPVFMLGFFGTNPEKLDTKESLQIESATQEKKGGTKNCQRNINKHLRILNLNIQSLPNKIDALLSETQNYNIDIMCLTEHFLTYEKLNALNFGKYGVPSCYCRTSRVHGGSLIMIRRDIQAKERNDLAALSVEGVIEIAAIEVESIQSIIISIYRPPLGSIEVFEEKLDELLQLLSQNAVIKNIFVAGDFNINFEINTRTTQRVQDIFHISNLRKSFSEPSRIALTSSTLIDNIFTNVDQSDYYADTVNFHLSDHRAQILTCVSLVSTATESTKKIIRVINDQNTQNFKEELKNRLGLLVTIDSAVDSFDCFHGTFMAVHNDCFPEKIIKIKSDRDMEYQTNDEIISIKNTLDALAQMAQMTRNPDYYSIYREFKRRYLDKVRDCVQRSNAQRILRSENKMKAVWDLINRETKAGKSRTGVDSVLAATEMNNYFCTIGEQLADSVATSESPLSFVQNMRLNNADSFFFQPVSDDEILEIVHRIKSKHTMDVYNVSTHLLKQIGPVISKPLADNFNRCASQGIFPKQLKVSKTVPVFKKGNVNDCTNYRPISVLPAISKIFELAIAARLMHYMEVRGYLSNRQHGFRKGHSVTSGIMSVMNYIIKTIDDNMYAEVNLLDLSKAFDTVSHHILLEKLLYYGIRGNSYKLLESYLSGREQITKWNGSMSEPKTIKYGVPQGSILGPLLFIIYVNDLPFNILGAEVCLYADDTTLLLRGENIEEVHNKSNSVIKDTERWFAANKLLMNPNKVQKLIISTRAVERCVEARFLGLTMDSHLKWDRHIAQMASKLTSASYAIKRLKLVATHEVAKIAYFSNFHSFLSFGILFWGMAMEADRVFLLQKKAVRTLRGLKANESCRGHFRSEGILTVPSLYILTAVSYVHQNKEKFHRNGYVHQYTTRNRDHLRVPYHRVCRSQGSIDYWGPKLYNKLQDELKSLPGERFKQKVKRILVEMECYSIEEYFLR